MIIAVVALGWGVWRTGGSDRAVAPAPGTLVVSDAGAAGLRETVLGESVALENPRDSEYCRRTVESDPWSQN